MEHARTSATDRVGEVIEHAEIASGGRLTLVRYGRSYAIECGDDELMGSVAFTSEEALATLTHDRLKRPDARVLIGGLGFGYTLRAALAAWGQEAMFVVAELMPAVVRWAEGPLADIFGGCLADPRLTVRIADVHDVIDTGGERFDAILLDVDNGPDGFMRPENDRLYSGWGLRAARGMLNPGGILAVWSAYPDAAFADDMCDAGFGVEEVDVPAYQGATTDRHRIWFGTKAE